MDKAKRAEFIKAVVNSVTPDVPLDMSEVAATAWPFLEFETEDVEILKQLTRKVIDLALSLQLNAPQVARVVVDMAKGKKT